VSTGDLPLVDNVTVPVLAFTPANGPLVRDCAAADVTITASATTDAPSVMNPFRVPCIAFLLIAHFDAAGSRR
jgi:hypothetical protein